MIDVQTGKALTSDAPLMKVVNRVWLACSIEEHKAFHRVCCLNSRAPEDMKLALGINEKIRIAIDEWGSDPVNRPA